MFRNNKNPALPQMHEIFIVKDKPQYNLKVKFFVF